MKKIQCARCGRYCVPYFWGNPWCKTDGLYFCIRCSSKTGKKCPKCHRKIDNWPGNLLVCVVAILVIVAIIASFVPGDLNEMMFWGELKDIEPTPIENISLDEKVVIIGVVESSNRTPLQGFKHDDDGEFYFEADKFLLTDDSGNISVEVDPDVTFGWWSHYDIDDELNRYWFDNGDEMVVAGKVMEDQKGNRTIKAVVITEYYSDFEDKYNAAANFVWYVLIVLSILFSLILIGIAWTKRRIPVHERNYSGPMIPTEVFTKHTSQALPSTNTEWIENPRFKEGIKWLWIWGMMTAIIIGIMVCLFLNGLDLGWLGLAWLPPYITGIIFIIGFVQRYKIPTHLGFDARGFHFKYARPEPKKEKLRFVEWKDIDTMVYYTELNDHILKIIFKNKDSEEVEINFLTESLIKEIIERFNNKKARSGFKKAVTTKVEPDGDIHWERPQALGEYRRNISILLILSAIIFLSFIVGHAVYILLLIPAISIFLALLLYWQYLSIPALIAITPKGIYLKNRKGTVEFLDYKSWDMVAFANNNLLIYMKSGAKRFLQSLSLNTRGSIVRSFERYGGLKTERKALQNLSVKWYENPAYGYYGRLMKLLFFISIVIFMAVTYLGYVVGDSIFLVFYIFLIIISAACYLILKRIIINTPTRIGFSKFGIHLDYPPPFHDIMPSFVPFTDIIGCSGLVTPKQNSRLSRMKDNEIIIVTKYGRYISVKPVDYDNVDRYLDSINKFHQSPAGEKWRKKFERNGIR